MISRNIDIEKAAERISKNIISTELIESQQINEKFGIRVFVKPECKQKTGSFKYRGAYNFISKLYDKYNNKLNVVCFSSGNHGQAVAAVAKKFNIKATVIVPDTAPDYKILNIRKYDPAIIIHKGSRESMEKRAHDLAKSNGSILVKPFDNEEIIAGQGTIGAEICKDMEKKNLKPDAILVPCSGGGLAAGIALGVKKVYPNTIIHPVEPEYYDDTRKSLIKGKIISNSMKYHSICDALLVPKPGLITFEINKILLDQGFVVSDKEVIEAMKIGLNNFKLILEPGGAVGLAVLLKKQLNRFYKNIVIIASGGNISIENHQQLLKYRKESNKDE
ncbi:MAG: pyridoxal-5'-phosphate-dependent protein [Rhodospirillaceae bacterium]|nr:pyridoxal-5'-phosphate-dependent protein [Rhodospirillaceae bacterium]